MKRHKHIFTLLLAANLLLPCLFNQLFFGKWFPYHLSGKHFLAFYLCYMLAGYVLLAVTRLRPSYGTGSFVRALVVITLMLSVTRIIQGTYHHKPVSFLVMLTLMHLVVLGCVLKVKRLPAS